MHCRKIFSILLAGSVFATTSFANGFVYKTGADLLAFGTSIWSSTSANNLQADQYMEHVCGDDPNVACDQSRAATNLSFFASALNAFLVIGDSFNLYQMIRGVGFREIMRAEMDQVQLRHFKVLSVLNSLPFVLDVAALSLSIKVAAEIPDWTDAVSLVSESQIAAGIASLPTIINAASMGFSSWYLWRLNRNLATAPLLHADQALLV